ncbi:hypothetical protein AcV5_003338 [Taiwanofungus camphoratus]|nr:hypothetical protein AcV5_003338 [Antrodia cinnamomea]
MVGGYQLLKGDPSSPDLDRRPRSFRAGRIVVGTLFVLGTAVFSLFYVFPSRPSHLPSNQPASTFTDLTGNEPLKQCASGLPPPATPPAPVNPWASLTVPETVDISDWLNAPERALNLTPAAQAALSDSLIYHITAFRPAKADALAYLADPDSVPPPERYARVTLHHGAAKEPYVQDYLVGPIPVGERTAMRPLTEIYHRDFIPHNARGYVTLAEINPLLLRVMHPLAEVTKELFGGAALGLRNDTLVAGAVGPLSFDGSFRRAWINWRRNVPGTYLHPVGFFLYIDMSGTDPDKWELLKIVYNHQVFPSAESFLEAFHNGTLKRLPARPDQQTDLAWTTRTRPDVPSRDLDDLPGPRSVSFAGLRFRIDRATQYVTWMGWGMYLGFDRDMGLSLWDVRFRGERLIYELAPQEAIAQYAGNDPMQSTTAWLDRFFGMFDYIFHLDGTIEVRLSASGYLQGGFWEATQEGYGTAIRDTTMGSLHDHVINYKVDLDVAGLQNSLLFTSTAQEEITQPWFEDDWGSTVIQQKITRTYIDNENSALLKFPTNFQGGYSIVNTAERNHWNIPRGYAIHPGYSPVHNTVVGSKRLLNNANWARYNLAVSRRKETEPTSSSMWNQNLPGEPMVDFHKFFDGENITQEDLVAWVNVGMHHLPQAEDAPNTRTNVATSSFLLTPLNYFDEDISMDSMNAILLSPPEKPGDAWSYNDYGVKAANCVPSSVPPFEYSGVQAFGPDGKMAPPESAEEMRKGAELYHRIKLEL